MNTRIRVTKDTSVSFSERDNIIKEVATRARSIDFLAAMHYLPNPDPVLKKQGKDITVYNELLVDPAVSAAVASFVDGVTELEWDIDRGKSKSRNAKIIRDAFLNINSNDESGGMYRIISEILSARLYGYQPCEVMWGKVGSMILPTDIIAKPQHWFLFDELNNLRFRTHDSLNGEAVPDFKFICPTYQATYDNPYGRPVLSSCFWPVTFKKGGLKFFIQFCEKYGMPYIIGEHSFTKQEDVDKFVEDLDAMVADGVIAIAKDKQIINVAQTGNTSSSDIFSNLVAVMREEISYAILNHNAGTSATPGKLGNEDGALTARASVINSGKKLVQQALNVVIKWTHHLNGMSGDVPRFVFYEEDEVDMALAERDASLSGQGVKFTKSYFIKAYGLEDEDFELGGVEETKNPAMADFADASKHADQQLVDEIVELLSSSKRTKDVSARLVTPIIEYVERATSYEDALSELASLFPSVDVDNLQRLLAHGMAAAHAIGRAHSHE